MVSLCTDNFHPMYYCGFVLLPGMTYDAFGYIAQPLPNRWDFGKVCTINLLLSTLSLSTFSLISTLTHRQLISSTLISWPRIKIYIWNFKDMIIGSFRLFLGLTSLGLTLPHQRTTKDLCTEFHQSNSTMWIKIEWYLFLAQLWRVELCICNSDYLNN